MELIYKDSYILFHSTFYFSRPDIVSACSLVFKDASWELNEPIGFLVCSRYNLAGN